MLDILSKYFKDTFKSYTLRKTNLTDSEMDEEFSDQDSCSLLQDLPAPQSRGAAENVAAADSGTQTENKEINKEINLNHQNQPLAPHSLKPAAGSSSTNEKIRIPKILNKRNGKGETYLHGACRRNNLAQVKSLIQAGISVNMEDNAGWTALHEASKVGAEAVVEELLRAGADANARSCNGVTPLHDAVSSGNYPLCPPLLKRCVDQERKNKILIQAAERNFLPGLAGLRLRARGGGAQTRAAPPHLKVVKLLLQNGSNPSDREVGGRSAFDMTAEEAINELLATFQTSSLTQERSEEEAAPRAVPESAATNLQSTEPSEGGGANELRNAAAGSVYFLRVQSHSMTVAAVLEDMRKKQTEIPTWPLRDLKDADKYGAALTQIQSVLAYILDKQRSEKEHLAEKYRTVPRHFHQTVLKSQFLSLASCQRKLVEILQTQIQLEHVYVTEKNKMSDRLSTRQNRERSERCRPAVQVRRRNAAVQTRAEDDRSLCRLLRGGVLTPGSSLRVVLKGKQHAAQVRADGAVVSKGKVHRVLERWLESILGKNIPVSSAYALEKVTFRDKPLAQYFLNVEAEENGGGDESAPEAGNWRQMVKNIKTIRLVREEEFLPSAVMDYYWDKLLKQTPSELQDWDTEL